MVRRRYSGFRRKSRSGGNGLMSLLKPILFGAVASYGAKKFMNADSNMALGAGAVGGYLGSKGLKGAALGAAGSFIESKFVSGSATSGGW
jgi:hypothetical protein